MKTRRRFTAEFKARVALERKPELCIERARGNLVQILHDDDFVSEKPRYARLARDRSPMRWAWQICLGCHRRRASNAAVGSDRDPLTPLRKIATVSE
jgi:hypothetical protein